MSKPFKNIVLQLKSSFYFSRHVQSVLFLMKSKNKINFENIMLCIETRTTKLLHNFDVSDFLISWEKHKRNNGFIQSSLTNVISLSYFQWIVLARKLKPRLVISLPAPSQIFVLPPPLTAIHLVRVHQSPSLPHPLPPLASLAYRLPFSRLSACVCASLFVPSSFVVKIHWENRKNTTNHGR